MRNTIGKILVAATFGLILSGSVMAAENVDKLTVNLKNDTNKVSVTDVKISQSTYIPNILPSNSIFDLCYETSK